MIECKFTVFEIKPLPCWQNWSFLTGPRGQGVRMSDSDRVKALSNFAYSSNCSARIARDDVERREAYAEKGKYLSLLIEIGGAKFAFNETCDRGMISVTVEPHGHQYHVPISDLSPKAREIASRELCGV